MNLAVHTTLLISLTCATLITGITVYYVLSYLLVDMKFTLPLSVTMALLSFGLTRYYSIQSENIYNHTEFDSSDLDSRKPLKDKEDNLQDKFSNIIFVTVYLILIVVSALSVSKLDVIYISWNFLDVTATIQLAVGIVICFFMPGYAIILILSGRNKMNPLLKVLLAYLCSILITALTVYLSSVYFDSNISQDKLLLISVNLIILGAFVVYNRVYRLFFSAGNNIKDKFYQFIPNKGNKCQTILKLNLSEIIVFSSLFALLTISTFYLYGGVTIGDQWYHQNRAIFFVHGNFKEFTVTNGDQTYTPLLSSLLAGLTSLTGVPLVNSYASIAFLNITAAFAFHYFCKTWLPSNKKRAALLASTFFVIASGLGWIYILYLADASTVDSQINSISYFVEEKIRVSDIRLSANFMIAAFPDFSTGLTLIALPAGFVLLALIYLEFGNKITYIAILSLISLLGILFHDEFYLFILVSSILPLVYNLKKKTWVYFALLIALASAFVIDSMLPVKYFTSHRIFGISVIELNLIFIIVTLSLYILRQRWSRHFHLPAISISTHIQNRINNYTNKIRFIPKLLLISIFIYAWAFCFLVWSQLPSNYVDVQTGNYNTPWYLYSMRLGAIGLAGIASILSYVFKRFEKEIFVFGIIIIIALIAGPYYNEQRFNKYVMAGLAGFASIIIFKLLNFVSNKQPVMIGVLIGSIVVVTSLSTLMYIGYNALVVETQDYTHALGRRNFPSLDELNVFDLMRSKIQDGSNHLNVATFSNEYNFRQGDIISKLHAFSGLPLRNAIQTQYLLNASTLESLYHLLESSNTGYIMIPTYSINQTSMTDPLRFVFENFEQIHKDDNYLIFGLPSVHGPSTKSENKVGVIQKDELSSSMVSDKKKLPVSNSTFDYEEDTTEFVQLQKGNQSEKAILYGYKKNGGKTFWSKDLGTESINYIELTLRSLNETKASKGTIGLKWNEGSRNYFLSLSDKGLQLREQTTGDGETLLLSQNSQVKNDIGIWYQMNVESLNDSINVYIDNLLKIKVPRNLPEDNELIISRLGINSENSVAEFESPQIGKIKKSSEVFDNGKYDYYYTLTSLALSKSEYSSYSEEDQSIFSNSEIILPFDSEELDDEFFNRLLKHTMDGGTLVVINSDDKFSGRFSKFFSIIPNVTKTGQFSHISRDDDKGPTLNVSGTLNYIKIKPSNDTSVISSYRNIHNKPSVPFEIEKNMSDKGRIIYINGVGYVDAISNNPQKYFASLGNFSNFFELDLNKSSNKKNVSEPIKRFIGDVSMTGKILVNGSSFSMTKGSSSPASIHVNNISVWDAHGNLKNRIENLSVTDIKILGEYDQFIKTKGELTLPSTDSQLDYLGMSLPNGFNMSIRLLNDKYSTAEIITTNTDSWNNTIQVKNESRIEFYDIKADSPISKSVPILVKNPEIIVNGNVRFDKTNFYGQEIDDYIPLNISGEVKAEFDFIEDFKEPFRHGTKVQYLTYLGSLSIDGKRSYVKQSLELPGDISQDIKARGFDVPLISILQSSNNLFIITAIIIASSISMWLLRGRYS